MSDVCCGIHDRYRLASFVISLHSIAGLLYPFFVTAIIASATSLILFHIPTSLKKGYIAQKKYRIIALELRITRFQ